MHVRHVGYRSGTDAMQIVRSRSFFSQNGPVSVELAVWPKLHQVSSTSIDIWPKLARVGPCLAQFALHVGRIRPTSANSGLQPTDFGGIWGSRVLAMWGFGDLGTWKFGDSEICGFVELGTWGCWDVGDCGVCGSGGLGIWGIGELGIQECAELGRSGFRGNWALKSPTPQIHNPKFLSHRSSPIPPVPRFPKSRYLPPTIQHK